MAYGQTLSDDILITVEAPTIAGTTTIDSTAIDMAGFAGVLFIVRLGTAAANNDIRVQQDTVVGMGAAADMAGTKVASGANNVVAVEYLLAGAPAEQFVRCRVTRGTSSTIDSVVAVRFGAHNKPTTWSGISFESWTSAAEGTA
jgi:hypothetical protein